MKLFFFDTETTWTSPSIDRIIQFWGIFWEFNTNTFEFNEEKRINQFIYIDMKIPEEATAVHWITNEDLEGYWYIDEYLQGFIDLVNWADYVVGHNVYFDADMITAECRLNNVEFNPEKVKRIDTMRASTELVNGKGGKWPKLIELYKFLFWKQFENVHDAIADIEATKDCFLELCRKYKFYEGWEFKKTI